MGQPKTNNNSVTNYYSPPSNQSVPSQIKCVRCGIVKNPAAFAKKRLDDLKNEIAKKGNGYNAAKQACIACMQCVGQQVNELFCSGCDKWKGLNSFSKAQRRTPDKAKCWPCMEEQLNTEPGASSDDDNSGSNSDSDSDDSQCGTTLAGPLSNMSITNGGPSSTGGVAVGSSALSKASTATPPHLRNKSPGSRVSIDSGNSKFAKVKAAPRKVYMDTAQRERDREERELDDDVEVVSSDSNSD